MGVALTTWEVMDHRADMLGVLSEIFAEVGSDHALIGGIAVGLVALEFQASVSPTRALLDRQQDIIDMARVIAKRFDSNDEAVALRLADLMYPGARAELAAMIAAHRAGRPVSV